jgi:alkanesulfonate monooxygenase SsuD/methylene tetrahydromethanopterin reductase-like flavin-dependent oxidoreductase (luciferase family)
MTNCSLYLSTAGADWDETRALTQMAERLEYRAVWLMDNTAGWAGAPHETPLLEPWAAIPALAEATDRVALGTLATPPGRVTRPFWPGKWRRLIASAEAGLS